ncbi:sialyltransferase [Methanobrevibacter sp. DSM 116169]|uniref:sialyltransferase n=1 Tax=Methanobrevibacter sp. DSM 116169 TaxID=3242727 RepID=UPI0038FC4D2B
MTSVKDLTDVFFKLEDKYDLNHMEIQDVYPWQLIRMYLYYKIANELKIFGMAQQSSLSLFDKFKSFIPFIKNSILKNPFSGSKSDILIFDHPRKTLFKEMYQDIYSYFLVDYLMDEKISFEVLESPYFNKHFTKKEDYIKYTDRILLSSYFYKKINKVNFTLEELDKINLIKNELFNEFNLEIDLKTIMENHILNFKHDYKEFYKLLKSKNPKKIFVVVSYENQAIVKAAKDLKIEVIELQHGTISKYHLGYSYPNDETIEYFPDKILTFGDYWKSSSYYPIDAENLISIGFPYFDENSKHYPNHNENSKKILFISQGVIGKYLSEFVYEVAVNLPDYEIIYKLHPGEYGTWKDNYESLVKACELDNFKVIDNSDVSLYGLFAKSAYQVGVFSTAIYEGLSYNCKTFVLDLPGVEYLDDLVHDDYVLKINSVDDLVHDINLFKPKEYSKNFFFKKYDKNELKKVIK